MIAPLARRVTIVQYAGDFREAAERLAAGGAETYRGQRYTVGHVEHLAASLDQVTTITGFTDTAHDVILPSGARAIGAGFVDRFDHKAVVALIEKTSPDALILRTPSRAALRWAIRNDCRTMLLIADSFAGTGIKNRLTAFLLARYLRKPVFDVVANHGRQAAAELVRIGVPADKVVAWDYPAFDTPAARAPRTAPGDPLRLLYAGMLIPQKGVDDLVHAVALLRSEGVAAVLDVIGNGDTARVASLAGERGVGDAVRVIGPVPNAEMIGRMAAADVVVVPSRHDYPEGMPLTIYEALCARTPLVVSDHPMFVENIVDGTDGLIFPAGDAAALAVRLARLARDPALFSRLSENGAAAWERLQIPVKWDRLIDAWIADTDEDRAWIAANSLAGA